MKNRRDNTHLAAALALASLLAGLASASALGEEETGSAADDFKAYDLTELSYLPPSLLEKGYEVIPIIQMCEMWDLQHRYGEEPCAVRDYTSADPEVVRKRADENLGVPLVAINIEQNAYESSAGWNFRNDEPEIVKTAVARWQELVSIWREVNPDTRILIYGPMPRIWWPITKNRKYPGLRFGQSSIDTRWENSKLIAVLFEDKSLVPWVSTYMQSNDPEVYREERRWQIKVCKELYQTECIFAVAPVYMSSSKAKNRNPPIDPEQLYDILVSLKEDGADGFGMWHFHRFDNKKYLDRMRQWEEKGGRATPTEDAGIAWLDAVDRFLAEDL